MVEVNAETDFVARNEQFQAFVEAVAKLALTVGDDVEALKAAQYPDSAVTVAEHLTQLDRHDRREHHAAPCQAA